MKNLISEWEAGQAKIAGLEEFLTEQKGAFDKEAVDKKALEISNEVSEKIDCLDCGNCCRTSVTDFTKGDIKRAAKHLSLTPKAFIKAYLMQDVDGTYITMTTPCPMLNDDNTCKIYEVRPAVCSSYPHTSRGNFITRSHAHKANLSMCPITYHTVLRLQENIKNAVEDFLLKTGL